VKKNHLRGIPKVKFDKDRLYGACEAGKLAKKHHSSKTVMTTARPLEILHMDLFRPQNYSSFGDSHYGLVIVDYFSRYTWVFFLEDKTCTQDIFKRFAKKAQNEYDVRIKHGKSYNGNEFKNTNIEDFLDENGITHEFSAAYTPQQNGVVELNNRTLIEMARTMLSEYKTPIRFSADAINTACHIINRVYLHKFLKKTSYELITGKKPNVSYLRVFGAPCFILDLKHSSKFAPKAHEGFLLGSGSNSHTYHVYNSHHGKVMETVNLQFDESNSSQKEHLPNVIDKPLISNAIWEMAIGIVKPVEGNAPESSDDDVL
jgi:hypothetical protein